MKTTIEISDALLNAARDLAQQEGTTVRALVERGLRHVLANSARPAFRLRDASVDGRGLHPDAAGRGWDGLAETIYEGRGG